MANNAFPLNLRFVGPRLKTRGVPIQDLGETFILMQHMVYKTYFIREKQSFRKAVPSRSERNLLALEIGERERGSDIYHLAWLSRDLVDAALSGALQGISGELAAALMLLGSKTIWQLIAKHKRQPVDLLAIALYNDLEELTSRIGNGIGRIEIRFDGKRKPFIIDAKTRQEIKDAKRMIKKGGRQPLEGDVIAPHTLGEDYAFVRVGMERIKVYTSKAVFRNLMSILGAQPTARVRFIGRPRLMIDYDPERFVEFFAESVERA